MSVIARLALALAVLLITASAAAQPKPPADETALGVLPITPGDAAGEAPLPKIGVLPSLSPDLEDVLVRGIVRRDLELTGMFEVIPDAKAPPGVYGFEDQVDVEPWKKLGAESVVKVAARKGAGGKVEVFGLAYFVKSGNSPVYQKKLLVDPKLVRETAHRMTDALLGALTGSPGGFASHFTFAAPWGKNRRIFTMDSDGHDLKPITKEAETSIAPVWGPNQKIFYSESKDYSPFRQMVWDGKKHQRTKLTFKTSIYSTAFDKTGTKMAVAVADMSGSAIWMGNADGSNMKKVSTTPLATHPVFSPSGKLAWIGGGGKGYQTQRVYVDGKAASPAGFTAAAPTFCETEDGIRLVYAVNVRGDRQDLVMSKEKGGGTMRLTQNQGANSYPSCSPDGRMLAFYSTRGKSHGIYFMSLKRWRTVKLNGQRAESLRWEALPPPPAAAQP
jgi:TolB protein